MIEGQTYDDGSFWSKLAKAAKSIGRETVEKALWLFYAAKKPETPVWAKGVIGSALAYLILPVDAIPDFIPGVGYADDAGAIAAAIGLVSFYIDAGVKEQAAQKLRDWFG